MDDFFAQVEIPRERRSAERCGGDRSGKAEVKRSVDGCFVLGGMFFFWGVVLFVFLFFWGSSDFVCLLLSFLSVVGICSFLPSVPFETLSLARKVGLASSRPFFQVICLRTSELFERG